MPKLFEYLGITVWFYSDEHEPIHVHGRYQGAENRAEILVANGQAVDVRITKSGHKRELPPAQQADFETLVRHYAAEIVQAWPSLD